MVFFKHKMIQYKLDQYLQRVYKIEIMTTFQRFKRDMRARNNSQGKSSIRKVSQINDKRIHDKVIFSASEILFAYNPNSPISTFILKITNITGTKIHFKIRCNNSKSYTVNPFQQVIQDQATCAVKFQFLPNFDGNNVNDKFQVIWGKIPYQPTQPASLTQSKIFPVKIIQRNQDIFKEINNSPKSSIRKIASQSKVDWSPQKQPSRTQSQSDPSPKYETILTKTNLILVCIISFLLGFIFS